jgi:uncharacterized membrane protein
MPNPRRPARPASPKREGPNYSTSTTTGIEPNVAAALSYILALVTGIIFLLMEKENRFIRFHAAQSIAVSVIVIGLSIAVSMISGVLVFIPVLGWVAVLVLTLGLAAGIFALWVVLMWKAYQGETWELPVAGGIARRFM